MPINKRVTSWAKKWWNSHIVGSLCEVVGIRAGSSYYIRKYLPLGYTVHGGIFKGMKYLDTAVGSSLNPKLIGTYESEIAPWIISLKKTYDHIVNLGCAEGYYAVGLARKFPISQLHAYDIDPIARNLCRKLAKLNEVANITIGNFFNAKSMTKYKGSSLIVCDIEGAEEKLLDPKKQPALLDYDYIIECHDHILPVSTILIERFKKTHDFRTVTQEMKRKKPKTLLHMPDVVFALLSDEARLAEKPVWLRLMRRK